MNDQEKRASLPLTALRIGAGGDPADARKLAEHLGIPVTEQPESGTPGELSLLLDQAGLALQYQGQSLRGDFSDMTNRLRAGNLQREMLVKAARVKGIPSPLVIDATAGMGEDALILAAAGFRVQLYERDPVIAALLKDSLRRAARIPEFSDVTGRMELHEGDSIAVMRRLTIPPDVILLDPMFPEKQKSSLTKKKFQLLHLLERPCEEEDTLLQAAVEAGPRKIIIKRPLKGSYLSGRKPDYSLKGKAIRYDCIVFARKE